MQRAGTDAPPKVLPVGTRPRAGLFSAVFPASKYPRLDCSSADPHNADAVRAETCKLANRILDEWGRRYDDAESCLDMNSVGCDWNATAFAQAHRSTQLYQKGRELDYLECKRFTHND